MAFSYIAQLVVVRDEFIIHETDIGHIKTREFRFFVEQ